MDDDSMKNLDSYVAHRVLLVFDKIQNYVSNLDDQSSFDESELAGCPLGDDEFVLEWINGWGRVQFIFDTDNNDDIVYMNNRNKESCPKFTYYELDISNLSEIVSDAAKFIASFS